MLKVSFPLGSICPKWIVDSCGLVERKLDQCGVTRKKTRNLALPLSRQAFAQASLLDFFELGQWFSVWCLD